MQQSQSHTIADLVLHHAQRAPEADALIDENGAVLSYGALHNEISVLAAQLAQAAPSRKGRPRIGVVLPNGPDMAVTLLSAALAGEVTPFNPALKTAELERYFNETRIDALILAERDSGPAASVALAMGVPLLRLTPSLRIAGVADTGPVPMPQPDDVAMVLMTSGSTGMPKIVPLSHRNVCRSAGDVAQSVTLGPKDRCLVMWQQFHIGGLVDLLLAPLFAGGALIVTKGFDAEQFFELSERFQPTWFQGVPTTLGALVQHAKRTATPPRTPSLRFIRSVAAALTPSLQDRLTDVFGVPIVRTLGMTEASPLITSTALPPAVDKPGSVGQPCGPELCIFGAGNEPLGVGQTGDIAIRGENVFAGYENAAEANADAFRDGWFFTGDTGYLDPDGDLFLSGRAKEQINRGGYKIMPSEVEEALSAHPAVHEAVVFGLSHPTLGEDIGAAVCLKTGTQTAPGDLRTHLSGLLAINKIPSVISILPDLPRNPVGKIDRLALAQTAAAEADSSAMLAAPRNAIERFLVTLWSRELSLPVVGIHQDFTMVGGDSLSALRTVVAMETVFERPVPETVLEDFTTIATIATALSAAGFYLPDDDIADAEGAAVRAFEGTGIGTEDLAHEDGFAKAVQAATNKTELASAFEGLTVYETPAAIRATLRAVDTAQVAENAPGPLGYLLRRRFRHNADEIANEINTAASTALGWQRTNVTSAALQYSDPSHPAWGKTLIVGFTGAMLRLQLPTYQFLMQLDPARYDLLLLRDASQNLFGNGLPDMADDLMKLGAWLDDFAASGGYERRMALGTSGGGLAAIYTAVAYGWARAVASSPPSTSVYAEMGDILNDLAGKTSPAVTEVIIANAQNERDMDSARQMLNIFPDAVHDFHAQLTSHNIINSAHRAGSLGALLSRWFA